jgi:hypothetical protein
MLTHAFERLGCVRVELKTDVLNLASRKAMLRIGAKEEGILRKHTLMWTGRYRDTAFYGILDEEWPQVKAHPEALLVRRPAEVLREKPFTSPTVVGRGPLHDLQTQFSKA